MSMKLVAEREQTYREKGWPNHVPVRPKELAAAGFYYMGKGDKVACFSCKGCLDNWEAGDDPVREHRRLYPGCPFVRDWMSIDRKIGGPTNDVDSAPSQSSEYNVNRRPVAQNVTSISKLGIPATGRLIHPLTLVTSKQPTSDVLQTCQHPKYAMENQRLGSFNSWPRTNPMMPMLLARAGFFFSGEGDKVICFYCDGALNNWERDDDPWVEHARVFRKCEWLLQQRGPFFMEHVRTL